ncbi:hypothetical protein LCGC14_0540240 [marine sediment metagenome]|uniref:Uncharacterized protein n=1 Tax=marine sediment metagenome TaxID=412755 RepID=A0A0F9SBG9_9ZZZZ
METLKNYIYETKVSKYVSERVKVDKGVYDFKIFSDQEVIIEEKDVKVKTGRLLEKHIRKAIKEYEENLGTEEVNETGEIEDMEDAISEVFEEEKEIEKPEEIEEIEEEVKEIEIKDLEDMTQGISNVFTKRNSPIEMRELFEILDTEIKKLDNVSFKTTTLDLVYNINGRGFLRIRPLTKYLQLLIPPNYYKDKIKLTEESEIDNTMIKIKENYELIKEMTIKK